MEEELSEKTLNSGEVITISKAKGGYDVDCWDSNGNNRWHKFYVLEVQAQHEYNRWN